MSQDGTAFSNVDRNEDANPPQQTRREFCTHVCQAASLLALGAAMGTVFPGCGGGGGTAGPSGAPPLPTISGSLNNGSIVLSIDSSSPLAAVGSAAIVSTASGPFLVAHTGQDAFTALFGVCTHQACNITGYASGTYVCPCHGSEFTTNGSVISGPAPAPLRQFSTQFANGQLTITV